MRVLKVAPNNIIKEIEIKEGLENLQKEVNGIIDIPFISEELYKNNIDIVINDCGKLERLDPAIVIINKETKEVLDLLAGNVLFTGFTEEGKTVGLTDEQIKFIKQSINKTIEININENYYLLPCLVV